MSAESPASKSSELLEFMFRLGQAYLACSEQTAVVESYLRQVASANGAKHSRIVTFPTAILIVINDGERELITVAEGPVQKLRLDQIGDVYKLGEEARRGKIVPQEGLKRLEEILLLQPRFGHAGGILGHALMTVGLAFVQMPELANIVLAAILGAVIGSLKIVSRDRPILAAPLSVICALIVSFIVFSAVDRGFDIDPKYALVPPLITFLPGAMLAFALVELTYGDMVSGSSRLLTGIIQLVLLVFGLVAGAGLVGYSPANLLDGPPAVSVPLEASLVGVAMFGIGIFVHFSAPRGSLPWIILVLFVAFAAQRLSAVYVGPVMSGFFGMLAVTPLGNLIQYRYKGPPSMVTFLPSFWLLVPGVLGLLSIKRMLTGSAELETVTAVVFAFTAIALGTLVGESMYRWLANSQASIE